MGAAAAVDAADEPLVVPNLACRRSTSRGGLATELTNAILTCRPLGLLAWAELMFWVSNLRRSSRSSWSLRYISRHDSYSWGVSRLKSRWQWRIHSSSESSVNHWLLCSMRYSCSGVHRSKTGSRISNGTPPTSAIESMLFCSTRMHCSYSVIIRGKYAVFEPEKTTILEFNLFPVKPASSSSVQTATFRLWGDSGVTSIEGSGL